MLEPYSVDHDRIKELWCKWRDTETVIRELGGSYEARNAYERFLLAKANGEISAKETLLQELRHKNISFDSDFIEDLDSNISVFPYYHEEVPIIIKTVKNALVLSWGRRHDRLPITEQIRVLLTLADPVAIFCCSLRYRSLAMGSQHWGLPLKYFQNLAIRNEGFASPFNARVLHLQPPGVFCSLCPEVDAIFGSVGNFFTTTLQDYPGIWMVNPPFIETIMTKAIQHTLASGVEAYSLLPAWDDAEAIQLCKAHGEIHEYLAAGEYKLVNANSESFTANFPCYVFHLGGKETTDTKVP